MLPRYIHVSHCRALTARPLRAYRQGGQRSLELFVVGAGLALVEPEAPIEQRLEVDAAPPKAGPLAWDNAHARRIGILRAVVQEPPGHIRYRTPASELCGLGSDSLPIEDGIVSSGSLGEPVGSVATARGS